MKNGVKVLPALAAAHTQAAARGILDCLPQ